MTRRTILILLTIFIAITILRETGRLHIDFYKSQVSSSLAKSFNDINYGEAGSLRNVPLIVTYKGYEKGETGTTDNPAVIVQIFDITHGSLWIPLFKHIDFSVGIPVSINRNGHNITGTVSVKGTLAIDGFCSRRDAKRLLVAHVTDNIYNTIRDQMDSYKNF